MKKFFFSLILVFSFFFFTSSVSGQTGGGLYDCDYFTDPLGMAPNECMPGGDDCTGDWVPGNCHQWDNNQALCEGFHACIDPDEPPVVVTCTDNCYTDSDCAAMYGGDYECVTDCDPVGIRGDCYDSEGSRPSNDPIDIQRGICNVGGSPGIDTAIGCIGVSGVGDTVNSLLTFALIFAGAIAFLLIIVGAFQVLASGGNPQRVAAGKELITSALIGLLLIIFAVFILNVIGGMVLGLPGFN